MDSEKLEERRGDPEHQWRLLEPELIVPVRDEPATSEHLPRYLGVDPLIPIRQRLMAKQSQQHNAGEQRGKQSGPKRISPCRSVRCLKTSLHPAILQAPAGRTEVHAITRSSGETSNGAPVRCRTSSTEIPSASSVNNSPSGVTRIHPSSVTMSWTTPRPVSGSVHSVKIF